MRQPSILDVVHAVKQAASAHPDVRAWWYAPPQRLGLAGEASADTKPFVEVAIDAAPDAGVDRERIASELARALGLPSVSVRAYRGAEEERPLYRLISAAGARLDDGGAHDDRPG